MKGVFSMNSRNNIFNYELMYPNHQDTELSYIIAQSIAINIYKDMSHCVHGLSCSIVQSHRKQLRKGRVEM